MSCKTETKQIGDHDYSVTQWPAEKSMLIKLQLAKIFGASLATLAGVISTEESTKDQDQAKAFSDGLQILFNNSSPEEIVSLIKTCVIGVAYDGKRITDTSYNEIFSGDELLEIYKVFIFVLQVNYANLFKGQLVETLLAKMKVNL